MSGNEVQMTKLIPWGTETLITLVFSNRAYALLMADNTYLASDGSLQKDISEQTLYTIEFYAGKIAFKSTHDKKWVAFKWVFWSLLVSNPWFELRSKARSHFLDLRLFRADLSNNSCRGRRPLKTDSCVCIVHQQDSEICDLMSRAENVRQHGTSNALQQNYCRIQHPLQVLDSYWPEGHPSNKKDISWQRRTVHAGRFSPSNHPRLHD